MVIMVDARTMGSRPSGIGMSLNNFLRELVKEKDFRLILISDVATSAEMQDMQACGAEIVLYGKTVFKSAEVFRYFSFVIRQAKRFKPDILWEPNNLLPLPILRFKGKIVLTIHDIFPITKRENYGLVYQLYFRFLLRMSISQADLLMYVSEFTKTETEVYSKQAAHKQSFISYNIIPGLQLDDARQSELSIQSKHDANAQPYFFYVGNIERRKGSDLLIKAYEKYALSNGEKRLYLAGAIKNDELKILLDDTNARLEKAGLKSIKYLGYVSKEEKITYMSGCACFVFPTRAEGFGMPIVEAMQAYRPIIASKLSIFDELIGDAIQYYPCDTDESKEIANLSEALHQLDNADVACVVDVHKYDTVMSKYSPKNLGDRIVQCFRELA